MVMSSLGLTLIGCVWSMLSVASAIIICAGYYLPYWLQGIFVSRNENDEIKSYPVYFGSFRRCNFLTGNNGIYQGCGRYAQFNDIPSVWWQVCTITVGLGCSLATVIAIVTLPAWWARGLITRSVGRVLGLCQISSALLISIGCILYPLGWNNVYVVEVCGDQASSYVLGTCSIGWAYYMMLGGACLLFICASLSTTAGRPAH